MEKGLSDPDKSARKTQSPAAEESAAGLFFFRLAVPEGCLKSFRRYQITGSK